VPKERSKIAEETPAAARRRSPHRNRPNQQNKHQATKPKKPATSKPLLPNDEASNPQACNYQRGRLQGRRPKISSSSVEAKFLYGGVLLHTLTREQPKHKIHLISQEVKFAYHRQTLAQKSMWVSEML
jgi:hypothetical protein